ncbi:hypothetical protein AO843_08200 [Lysinibacillus sp. ZYM-1]|nr:hypothetical protein AO843_08200 [Lysinibacillus sp. ZYM-1]
MIYRQSQLLSKFYNSLLTNRKYMFNVLPKALTQILKMLIRGSEGRLPMMFCHYGGWPFAFFGQKGSEME